jgi:hypothetical protein
MNYKTARSFLIAQGTALETQRNPDDFLMMLQQGKPPIPGQMTSILVALKIVFDVLRSESNLDRELTTALYTLSYESYRLYITKRDAGTEWPPLLDKDLERMAHAVKNIFAGTWQD